MTYTANRDITIEINGSTLKFVEGDKAPEVAYKAFPKFFDISADAEDIKVIEVVETKVEEPKEELLIETSGAVEVEIAEETIEQPKNFKNKNRR